MCPVSVSPTLSAVIVLKFRELLSDLAAPGFKQSVKLLLLSVIAVLSVLLFVLSIIYLLECDLGVPHS